VTYVVHSSIDRSTAPTLHRADDRFAKPLRSSQLGQITAYQEIPSLENRFLTQRSSRERAITFERYLKSGSGTVFRTRHLL
jgi:hypothetical protein